MAQPAGAARALGIELGVADLETVRPLEIREGRKLTAIVAKRTLTTA